jgi:hypothetical protein
MLKEFGGPFQHIEVPISDRVKGARINAKFHGRKPREDCQPVPDGEEVLT